MTKQADSKITNSRLTVLFLFSIIKRIAYDWIFGSIEMYEINYIYTFLLLSILINLNI